MVVESQAGGGGGGGAQAPKAPPLPTPLVLAYSVFCCKKSTSSSAAKHQLHLIFVAIWDTAHYFILTAIAIS